MNTPTAKERAAAWRLLKALKQGNIYVYPDALDSAYLKGGTFFMNSLDLHIGITALNRWGFKVERIDTGTTPIWALV